MSERAVQSGSPEPVLGVVFSSCVILLPCSPPECLPPAPLSHRALSWEALARPAPWDSPALPGAEKRSWCFELRTCGF